MYHLGVDNYNLFQHIKTVVVCGDPERAKLITVKLSKNDQYKYSFINEGSNNRFSIFKVDDIIVASHGMGCPSISILLHELIQAFQIAKNPHKILFIRVGTCGGIGLEPGTIVVSDSVANARNFEPTYEVYVCGQRVSYDAILDRRLANCTVNQLSQICQGKTLVVSGKTLTADCFYEGQARMDGFFRRYSHVQAKKYLSSLTEKHAIVNIEMEGTVLAALTYNSGHHGLMINMVLVNRLENDHPTHTNMDSFLNYVTEYILNIN